MHSYASYFDWPVYGLSEAEKSLLLKEYLNHLIIHHAEHCTDYQRILSANNYHNEKTFEIANIPFIPVRLFKQHKLMSILPEEVFKTLTSSGTTSQQVSQIILDRDTATAQTKALVLILQQFLGKKRLPMLIIDHPSVVKSKTSFSARGAGILGLSNFGRDHTYALHDDMSPNIEVIQAFIEKHQNERIFLFGFTFMVWKYFFQSLKDIKPALRFNDAILIHSGGWKKLIDEAVDNHSFKSNLRETFNIQSIHNFYGMVEQVGSIFMECEHGYLHTPAFADMLIRDAKDWSILPIGSKGLVQVLSVLPRSYPGHSLLTEDIGELVHVDDCPCGRKGKAFLIHGRVAKAELRGCSDTHAAESGNTSNGH
jgi:phenylacetate-coenzyme A ligase PaaK-like adenylate-forming protein